MKRTGTFAAVLGACLAVSTAVAQDNPVYFGIKAGHMDADASGFDEATNLGLIAGYDLFQDERGTLSFESEYTRTVSDGDIAIGAARGDWKIETLAGYGAYRTAGDVYIKAKAGFARRDARVGIAGSPGIGSEKDTGFSFGAGAGYRFNRKVGLEIEYTVIEDDVGFLSLGYFTHF